MSKNIEINIQTALNTYETLYPKTLGSNIDGAVSLATKATSADSLTNSRTIQTNLASTSSASFNGMSNITPGVNGVLPVGNGGTGTTSYSSLKTFLNIKELDYYTDNKTYTGNNTNSATIALTYKPVVLLSAVMSCYSPSDGSSPTITFGSYSGNPTTYMWGANNVKVSLMKANMLSGNDLYQITYYDLGNVLVTINDKTLSVMSYGTSSTKIEVINKNGYTYSWNVGYLYVK